MPTPIPGRVLSIVGGIIDREGGFVDHPSDPGGATKFGITERVARAAGFGGKMRDLPREVAVRIYLERYYEGPGFHRVVEVMPQLGEEIVDTGVNMGQDVAARFLQRALNALNRNGKDYPDLKVDGRIGSVSAGNLVEIRRKRGQDAEKVLLRLVECLQGARYVEICEGRPASEDFMFGWALHRIGNVKELA